VGGNAEAAPPLAVSSAKRRRRRTETIWAEDTRDAIVVLTSMRETLRLAVLSSLAAPQHEQFHEQF
jgi:hypothetical protein